MKQELLEGGLRIPSIVRWPGRIAAGSVSEQVMITMDWVLGFMNSLVAAFPDRELHVILDNLDTHKKNERWLKKHPKVRNLRRGIVHDFFYHIQVLPKGN
jgi:hypothetical protein